MTKKTKTKTKQKNKKKVIKEKPPRERNGGQGVRKKTIEVVLKCFVELRLLDS